MTLCCQSYIALAFAYTPSGRSLCEQGVGRTAMQRPRSIAADSHKIGLVAVRPHAFTRDSIIIAKRNNSFA